MKPIIEIRNVSYSLNQGNILSHKTIDKTILKDISIKIGYGEILGITGESGSGKTTLAKLLAGILQPTKGKIVLNIKRKYCSNRINHPVQILFQNNDELINPMRKVIHILTDISRDENDLIKICEMVDINRDLWNKKGFQLSGGERQRVALARILTTHPEVLILDEPFSAQDPESQQNFISLFKRINSEFKIALICISHDIGILKNLADEIIIFYGGKILEFGTADKIFNHSRHPYTKFLLNSINYNITREDFIIHGNSSVESDFYCAYYTRCNRKDDICKIEVDKKISEDLVTYCNYPF